MKQSKSILLIEDDNDDQEFFMEAVGEIENATLYAISQNGKEALDRLQQSSVLPDLIFSDVNMPFMNGIQCLAELKMNPRLRNIPVIILSSSTEDTETVLALGARTFVKKPNDFNILRAQIEKIVREDFNVAARMPAAVVQHLCIAA